MEKREKQPGYFWIVLISMALGLLLGLLVAPGGLSRQSQSAKSVLAQKALEIAELVEDEYVDEIDSDTIGDAILNAMLLSLDPHSHYLSAKELSQESELMQGDFGGIGVILHYIGDTVYVGTVMDDGPSKNSGLHPGDMIVAVNGDTVSGVHMDREETLNRIRGAKGTKVSLQVQRLGKKEPLQYTIVRGMVRTPSITYVGMLDASTGYVSLSRFSETTAVEFHDALKRLLGNGMKHLVLDLRGNGGGLLTAAVAVADELLPKGELIVYTQGSHQRRQNVKSSRGGLFEEGSLTVMIDEYSASASEIVAGAVQDNDRGTVVGRRSFGKGLVQNQFVLADKSAVWLTVARYYSPSGRCIQRPYNNGSQEYYYDFLERLANVPTSNDSTFYDVVPTDSTRFFTKKGRVVYGGGGITPDNIFPYIVDSATVAFNRLVNSGRPSEVAFDFVRTDGSAVRVKYPTASAFIKEFAVPESVVDEAMNGVKLQPRQKGRFRALMKAYVAQSLYGNNAFYSIYLSIDDDVSRVKNMVKK